ncbi:DUF7800 domain-containing protein [Parafrankia elaeagni]|uniref:DUF7800 domain-containing protein n=1 Tax=Parafrankia elaeagni TaxID=222534 RepID=UPI000378E638|nr:alkaline phosphatase D family protein [Parafrankia elaeagni]
MTTLLLGPLHRYADDRRATVWVETDEPCTVEIRALNGPRAATPTFTVAGHHVALVVVSGLVGGTTYPYEVWLTPLEPAPAGPTPEPGTGTGTEPETPAGAVQVWPEPGSSQPPSLLRPVGAGRPVRLVFGSCRVTAPQARPYTLSPGEDPQGLGTDALHALALRMAETPPRTWPDALLLLGDQVYADHVSPATAARIRARRDVTVPPGEEIADFTEYAWLYQEAWSQPEIRWLLSTIPTAMVADDHDVRDDWNISAAWRAQIRTQPWWDTRITSGIMAYWLYQFLGNLDPEARDADPVFAAVTAPDGPADGESLVRDLARRVDRMPDLGSLAAGPARAGAPPATAESSPAPDWSQPPAPPRWSYRWDLGRTRLVVIDSRLSRIVAPDGTRAMVHDAEWAWIRAQTAQTGEVDHLLLGTSVPYLLTPTIHHVETVSERLASGRFGRLVARQAERMRQAVDLEHWAAFGRSFGQMTDLLHAVAAGEHGPAPASVIVLSGDVHHAYLARATTARDSAPVWQAVCSPFRNPLGPGVRRVDAMSRRGLPAGVSGLLARLVGVRDMAVTWSIPHGPWFDSQLATLILDGRAASMVLEKTEPDGEPGGLDEVLRVSLTARPGEGRPEDA